MNQFESDWQEFTSYIELSNQPCLETRIFEEIKRLANVHTEIIQPSTVLFRARVIAADDILRDANEQIGEHILAGKSIEEICDMHSALGIYGYNAKHSGMPPSNKASSGRANKKHVPCLYLAKEPYTALAECKPYQFDCLSIATYKVQNAQRVASFREFPGLDSKDYASQLLMRLNYQFSHPVGGDKAEEEYRVTQAIAEQLKTLGYDGVSYNSSLHKRGCNYALFSDKEMMYAGSFVYEIKDIVFVTKPVVLNYHAPDITPKEYAEVDALLKKGKS